MIVSAICYLLSFFLINSNTTYFLNIFQIKSCKSEQMALQQ